VDDGAARSRQTATPSITATKVNPAKTTQRMFSLCLIQPPLFYYAVEKEEREKTSRSSSRPIGHRSWATAS
jgi:hypothetical protein